MPALMSEKEEHSPNSREFSVRVANTVASKYHHFQRGGSPSAEETPSGATPSLPFAHQRPVGCSRPMPSPRFNANSTTEDVLEGVDLTGKRAVVTGHSESADGIESCFAVCHLGHFALCTGLLDELKQSKACGGSPKPPSPR